ncbi:MAG: hypothetical protein CVT49_08100 [candidate division Zixibacteria bacterium HGW-Zixibacteria-1]|nr:MAG: hypothetical protein CVT49_08100 [candidate division Zixibacteria bacterium HGW-Zixibacteria-1]
MRVITQKLAQIIIVVAFMAAMTGPVAAAGNTTAKGLAIGGPAVWQVLAGGGTSNSTSADYRHSGTIGQTAVFQVMSSSNTIKSGFWMSAGNGGPCEGIPGDPNASDSYNILDPAYLINFLYRNGPAPAPLALYSGDPNCSCDINILDVSFLINYLYKEGNDPCVCNDWIIGCGLPIR